jgi:hypothetical protein
MQKAEGRPAGRILVCAGEGEYGAKNIFGAAASRGLPFVLASDRRVRLTPVKIITNVTSGTSYDWSFFRLQLVTD